MEIVHFARKRYFCETSYFALWKGGRFLWSCSPSPAAWGPFFSVEKPAISSGCICPGDPTPRIAEHETPVLSEARRQLLGIWRAAAQPFPSPWPRMEARPFSGKSGVPWRQSLW